MRIRRWGLDYCGVLAGFQSSVKDFQVGRYLISDRRTKGQDTPFISDRRTKGHDPPFISDRRTKGQDTHPQPLPKGGECRRLGEIRPERSETSQPKATPWELFATNIRPEWAKELLFRSLPLPLYSGGLLFFCPLRGRIHAASSPPGRCPGLAYQCPFGA